MIRNLLRISIVLAVMLLCLFSLKQGWDWYYHGNVLKCGTLVNKFSDDVQIKHGTSTDLIFIMNFNGQLESIKVNEVTYYSNVTNSQLCFDRIKPPDHPLFLVVGAILWAVIGLAILFGGLGLLITLGNFVFTGKFEFPNLD